MVFCFVQKFFFLSREFFPPEFNIRLYDKNSESDFFSSTKIRIFFSAALGIRIFILEKNHNHPWKLNGPSLSLTDYILSWKNILMVSVSFYWLDTSTICSKYGWRYTTGTFNDVLRSLTNEIHFHNSWKTWTDHFVSQYIIFY